MASDSYLHYIKIICYFYVQLTINEEYYTDFQALVSGNQSHSQTVPPTPVSNFYFRSRWRIRD